MNKKRSAIALLSVVVVIGLVVGLNPTWRNTLISFFSGESLHVMNGKVLGVLGDEVVIEGVIKGKVTQVKFKVDQTTVLSNTTLMISMEQIKSRQEFAPQRVERAGNLGELKSGTIVTAVTTRENLLRDKSVLAVEIKYDTYDLP